MSEAGALRLRLHPHAMSRMRRRGITAADIRYVLLNYESRRLARQLPHLSFRSEIFAATVRGRRMRVYVLQGSDPPYIMTAAWEKR